MNRGTGVTEQHPSSTVPIQQPFDDRVVTQFCILAEQRAQQRLIRLSQCGIIQQTGSQIGDRRIACGFRMKSTRIIKTRWIEQMQASEITG